MYTYVYIYVYICTVCTRVFVPTHANILSFFPVFLNSLRRPHHFSVFHQHFFHYTIPDLNLRTWCTLSEEAFSLLFFASALKSCFCLFLPLPNHEYSGAK